MFAWDPQVVCAFPIIAKATSRCTARMTALLSAQHVVIAADREHVECACAGVRTLMLRSPGRSSGGCDAPASCCNPCCARRPHDRNCVSAWIPAAGGIRSTCFFRRSTCSWWPRSRTPRQLRLSRSSRRRPIATAACLNQCSTQSTRPMRHAGALLHRPGRRSWSDIWPGLHRILWAMPCAPLHGGVHRAGRTSR